MGNADYEEGARRLKALSHPVRLHILNLMRENEPCVRKMEEVLGLAQPSISQHLSLLRNFGIVEGQRQGNQVCYRIKDKEVIKILDAIS